MNAKSILVCSLALLGLALAVDSAEACIKIEGKLNASSPVSEVVRPGCPYFTYRVYLEANETIVFEVESTDFNAFLVVRDAAFNVVARDNDSAGGTNPRVAITPAAAGWFEVIVTSNARGERGTYILTIRDAEEETGP